MTHGLLRSAVLSIVFSTLIAITWLHFGSNAGAAVGGIAVSLGTTMITPQIVNLLRGRRLVSKPDDAPITGAVLFIVATLFISFGLVHVFREWSTTTKQYRNQSLVDTAGQVEMIGVAYDGGRYVASGLFVRDGYQGKYRDAALWDSEDGKFWYKLPHNPLLEGGVDLGNGVAAGRQMNDIEATPDGFLIFGWDTAPDGVPHGQTWMLPKHSSQVQRAEGEQFPTARWYRGYAKHDSVEVLAGCDEGDTIVWRREQGQDWSATKLDTEPAVHIDRVRYLNGTWFLTGSQWMTDPDYDPRASDADNQEHMDGVVWISDDGKDWHKARGLSGKRGQQLIRDITYSHGIYIAVGSDDAADSTAGDASIWLSNDKENWHKYQDDGALSGLPRYQEMNAVVVGKDHLVVVGGEVPDPKDQPKPKDASTWDNAAWGIDFASRNSKWSEMFRKVKSWLSL